MATKARHGRRAKPPRGPRPRPRPQRPGDGAVWIYGRHAVLAALGNPRRRFRRLVVTAEAAQILAQAGIAPPVAAEPAAPAALAALLPDGAAHQGFAALAEPLPDIGLDEVIAALNGTERACVVVLDQVTDPRNVGAILRSAAAFGAAAVVLPVRHGAETTAALAKTASGALERVALVRVTNLSRALEALKKAGFWSVALDPRAPAPLAEADLSGRIALVLGSEGAGLRRLVAEHCDIRARLPISAAVESLNVSAAAAIALYEVARRGGTAESPAFEPNPS